MATALRTRKRRRPTLGLPARAATLLIVNAIINYVLIQASLPNARTLVGKALASQLLAPHAPAVRALQLVTTLEALKGFLDGETDSDATIRSILVRGLVKTGRPLDQLPRQAALSEAGRLFLLTPGLTEHIGVGALDLYLACEKISPTEARCDHPSGGTGGFGINISGPEEGQVDHTSKD